MPDPVILRFASLHNHFVHKPEQADAAGDLAFANSGAQK
jgi:hypothetical protein